MPRADVGGAMHGLPARRSVASWALLSLLVGSAASADPITGTEKDPVSEPAQSRIRAMTLEEALEWARAHQPAIRAARARIQAAKADASATRAQWRPYAVGAAEVFGGTSNNSTASYLSLSGLDIPRIGSTKIPAGDLTNMYATTFVAVSVNQELFDFGRIAAQAVVDDFSTEAESQRMDDVRLQIDLNVEEAFFAVKAAHAVLKASEEAYVRAQAHRDEAQAAVSGGLRAPIELTRAEADLARFDVGRVRSQGGLQSAESAFAAAVAFPELVLDSKGDPPPLPKLPSLQSAIARARERNPELQATIAQLRAQAALTTAIGALLRPNLSLSASFSGREGGSPATNGAINRFHGWVPETVNWDLGLVLRWPFYDGVVLARQDASAQREQVHAAEIEVVQERQDASIQQAWVSVTVAERTIPALERSVDAARANYAQASTGFKAGLGTSVHVADAAAVQTDAEIQLAIGQFDLARARAVMARLIAEGL
jgi:outer membrane protein